MADYMTVYLGGVGLPAKRCIDCGSLVYDTEAHDRWHEKIEYEALRQIRI